MIKNFKNKFTNIEKKKPIGWIDPTLMDSHQQRKHKRILAISNLIKKRDRVNYKKFLAEMQFNGLRKKVAQEYLEAIKDYELIKFDKEDIVWIGDKYK